MTVTKAAKAAPAADRIRRAALTLFAAKGFHGTGIRDLAEAAGLSSASLYHYMGTKEDLLLRIMRECMIRLLTAGHRVVAADPDPRSRLAGLVQVHVLSHALHPLETAVVDHELRALSPPPARAWWRSGTSTRTCGGRPSRRAAPAGCSAARRPR